MSNIITTINSLEHILPLAIIAIFFIAVSVGIEVYHHTDNAWRKENHLIDSERLLKSLLLLSAIDVLFILPLDVSSLPEFCIFVLVVKMAAFALLNLRFCSTDDFDLFLIADYMAITSIFVSIDDPLGCISYFAVMLFVGFLAWKFSPSVHKLVFFTVGILSVLLPLLVDCAFFIFQPSAEMTRIALMLFIYGFFKATGSLALLATNRL